MQTFTNQPYDLAISIEESSLHLRRELLGDHQKLIASFNEIISQQSNVSPLLLTNLPNKKRIKELKRRLSFCEQFSEEDSIEKIQSDIKRLEELPLVLSGWIYYSLEDIEYDFLEIGLDKNKNPLHQALMSESIQSLLTGDREQAILLYLRPTTEHPISNQVELNTPLAPRAGGTPNFFNETDFIQKKRELPMSTSRDDLETEEHNFVSAINALQDNYQIALEDIFEKSSSRSGRSKEPSVRHLKVLQDLQAHLSMVNVNDANALEQVKGLIVGHALTILDNLKAINKKTQPGLNEEGLENALKNNPLYQTLVRTFALQSLMSDELDPREDLEKFYYKNQYFMHALMQKPVEDLDAAQRAIKLQEVSKFAGENAKVTLDLGSLDRNRQYQHQKRKSELRGSRATKLELREDIINGILRVRDVFQLNSLVYQELIGRRHMPNGWYSETKFYQQSIAELESLLEFISDFRATDHNMKMQNDIFQLEMLYERAFGCALTLCNMYPHSPLHGAISEVFNFANLTDSEQNRLMVAYQDYLQQQCEVMPDEDDYLVQGDHPSNDVASTDHKRFSIVDVNAQAESEKNRLNAQRDIAYEDARPMIDKAMRQLEKAYNRLKGELADNRYFGQARDTLWNKLGGSKSIRSC